MQLPVDKKIPFVNCDIWIYYYTFDIICLNQQGDMLKIKQR